MNSIFKELQQRLQEIGEQKFTDDPKVIAIFPFPSKSGVFYITGYQAGEDCYFGYIQGEGIDSWGSFSRQGLEQLYEINQEAPTKNIKPIVLKEEPPVSRLIPEMKSHIQFARLEQQIHEHKKKKDQNKDHNTEWEH